MAGQQLQEIWVACKSEKKIKVERGCGRVGGERGLARSGKGGGAQKQKQQRTIATGRPQRTIPLTKKLQKIKEAKLKMNGGAVCTSSMLTSGVHSIVHRGPANTVDHFRIGTELEENFRALESTVAYIHNADKQRPGLV